MKRIPYRVFLSLLLVLSCFACDKAAPTEEPFLTPTPSVALELAGAWTGTISWARDPRSPLPQNGSCASEQVLADLAQTGTSLSLRIATRCQGMLSLSISLEGNSLIGENGLIVGTASNSRISMSVSQSRGQVIEPLCSIVLSR